MRQTIQEWLVEKGWSMIAELNKNEKVTEKKFLELSRDGLIFENKYYSK